MVVIRRLSKVDVEDYRAIRLEGLERHPDAFGASFSSEASEGVEYFSDRLQRDVIFGGVDETGLLGIICYYAFQQEKLRHKGVLYGMYVREEAQGTGLAGKLVQQVLSYACGEVESIQLTVVNSNKRALRFYERCGFETYGVEPKALKIGNNYLDEALMYRSLK